MRDWYRRHERWLRRVPAAAVAVALLVLVARNADVPDFPDYEIPEGFTPSPPPAPAAGGGVLPDLAPVRGTTTTTAPPNTGRARVTGTVTGPGGVVAGAVVRLERVIGDATQVLDVVTGPDGRYDAAGIGGGRYRVRAFLPPTLAQPTGTVLYLLADEERNVDLSVEAFAEPVIAVAVAPNPPLLDQPLNLAVRVTGRLVDAEGFVRTQALAGGIVQAVTTTGTWSTPSPTTATTDAEGQARFSARCLRTGVEQVQVTVRVPAAVPGTPPFTATLAMPECLDPSTFTTTTTTTTTVGGGSSTTTGASSTSSTTTTTAGDGGG